MTKKIVSAFFILFSVACVFAQEDTDSSNRLRRMIFEEEIFIPEEKEETTVLINKAENKAVREFYDQKSRIVKREVWHLSDARQSKTLSTEFLTYKKNSDVLESKRIITEEAEELIKYNEKGQELSSEIKHLALISKDGTEEKIFYPYLNRYWKYDKEGRSVYEGTVTFNYTNENFSKYTGKNTKEKKISYSENPDVPPDEEILENGTLLHRTKYESKGTYVTETFFDSDYTVKSFYENDRRIKDEYFLEGKLLRVKKYE